MTGYSTAKLGAAGTLWPPTPTVSALSSVCGAAMRKAHRRHFAADALARKICESSKCRRHPRVRALIEDSSPVHSAFMYNSARLQFLVALRRRWQVGVGPFVSVSVFCASACFVGFVLPVACGLVQNAPPTKVTEIANLH
jgi:hypothetical protein